MKTPGPAKDESGRLHALESYGILDTAPEEDLDALTRLTAELLDVPIALVSIVDRDRQWFKSRYGLDVPETPRDVSFCGHVVCDDRALVVGDALSDERFRDNPLVTGDPTVRFYAGLPLRTPDGHVLGTLCAIDRRPRALSAAQQKQIEVLAGQVMARLELRRSQALLAQREAQLAIHDRFFALSLDLLCAVDAEDRFVEVSPSWSAVLGWRLDELIGTSFLDLVHPEDRERTKDEARMLVREQATTGGFDSRFRHKDGRYVTLSWEVVVHGQMLYAAGRDITMQRAKETALARSESHLHALFEGMGEGVVVQNTSGHIIGFNSAAERILGLPKAQLIGLTSMDPRWRALRADGSPFPGDEHPAMVTLRTGEPMRDVVMRVHRPAGDEVWLGINSQLTDATDDRDRVVVTTFRDITRETLSQREIATERAFLATILEVIPNAAVIVFDSDLVVRESFGAVSPAARNVLERVDAWVPDAQRARFAELASRCWRGAEARMDLTVADRRLDVTFVPFRGEGGAIERGLAFVYDVTERAIMRERLTRQERLVTTGTLAAGVGHEINNPLAYVLSNIEFALEEVRTMAGGSPSGRLQSIVEVLQEAEEGAQRIRKIVRGLRAFSREEGSSRPTDVEGALRLSVNMAMHELRLKAQVRSELGPVPKVLGDEARLAQVFVNLLVNAAQAFKTSDPEVNQIVVRTRHDPAANVVVVEIADNGPGIPAEILPRIFDPFFTTKPVGVGTGLGLSISHSLVTGLGGELTCDTKVGEGTTFRVALPVAAADALDAAVPSAAEKTRVGRVLLVDDEPGMLRAMTRLLQTQHVVVSTQDPREAIRLLQAGQRFDVILCDLMMPHMNGMELYQEVLAIDPGAARRIVFVTGGVVDEGTRQFLATSEHERIEKPFAPQDLRAVVARYVDSPRAPGHS